MAFINTQSAQNTNILYAHKNTETYTGCDCPSERISSFVETLLHLIVRLQQSHAKSMGYKWEDMLQDGSDVAELLLNLLKNQVPVSPPLMAEMRRHVTALKELSKIKKFYEEERGTSD